MSAKTAKDDVARLKKEVAKAAAELIENDSVVGLGSGSTANYFIEFLGERIRKEKLWIMGVPTSRATEEAAKRFGIMLCTLDECERIDIAVDGADLIDEGLNLLKGYGGAHVREKIVAAAAKKFVVIADYTKCCETIALPVPVEVLPFGLRVAEKKLAELGGKPVLRMKEGRAFVSDNRNFILDVDFGEIEDVKKLEAKINSIPGVIDNGLFPFEDFSQLEVYISGKNGVERLKRR
jgi:ribose 5-phosphate isomerase A